MPSHSYHLQLEGYAPEQILHDGCPECERRGEDIELALRHLDPAIFAQAWRRAADWQASTPPSGHEAKNIADAEARLLTVLWQVQLALHNLTGLPLGQLPNARRTL